MQDTAKLKKTLSEWLWYRSQLKATNYTPTERKLGAHLGELLRKGGIAHVPKDVETQARMIIEGQQHGQGVLPFILVGAALVFLLSITRSIAENAKHEREIEYCKQYPNASRCQKFDWNKWLTLGALGVGAWFLWTRTTVLKGLKK